LNKLENNPDYVPKCVRTAPENTLAMQEIDAEDPKQNLFFYGDHVAIKAHSWRFKEEKL
jgi:hypothetical protein